MTVGEAVRTHLLTNTTLAAMVSTRIYPYNAKFDDAFPLVLMTEITNTPSGATPYSVGFDAYIQFTIFGNTLAEIKSIGREIRKTLDKPLNITAGDMRLVGGQSISAWRDTEHESAIDKYTGEVEIKITYFEEP